MAPVAITRLRREAIDAGMKSADARKAERAELLDFLAGDEDGAGTPKAAKKVVKKAVAKKKVAAPAKKKAANGRKTRAAAKPVRKQTRKPAARRKGNGDVGRAEIAKIDYSVESDAWKPRSGSPVELIWKSLKKHRDDVDKVFNELRTQLDKFTEPKSRTTGARKSKIEREATLRYRINRTRFEYAVRTGQHESGTERVNTARVITLRVARTDARRPLLPSVALVARRRLLLLLQRAGVVARLVARTSLLPLARRRSFAGDFTPDGGREGAAFGRLFLLGIELDNHPGD